MKMSDLSCTNDKSNMAEPKALREILKIVFLIKTGRGVEMNGLISVAAGGVLGITVNSFFPEIVNSVIKYKCNRKDREVPLVRLSGHNKIAVLILHMVLYISAFFLMPVPNALFTCVFVTVAVVSAIVDHHIHIIANEVILFLLLAGIAYRFVDGVPGFFKGSLQAVMITAALFGGAAAFTYMRKNTIGVGAGDLKLVLVISFMLGYPTVLYFLGGLAFALIAYCIVGIKAGLLTLNGSFPMCAHIMFGFTVGLFYPYIAVLIPTLG